MIPRIVNLVFIAMMALPSFLFDAASAFTRALVVRKEHMESYRQCASSTSLYGLFGDNQGDASAGNPLMASIFGTQKKESKEVWHIPADEVKVGALKFLLKIYLVGEQNNPTSGSWQIAEDDESGALQMYYQDGTGMLSLKLQEYGIWATRHGQRPSLQYVLQESMLLHGVLDELHQVAFEVDDIDVAKRLLRCSQSAIQQARAQLQARKDSN